MTYTIVYAIFLDFLFESEIWSDSLKVFFGEFRERPKVIDGMKTYLLTTKRVDRLRLMVSQIGMPLKPVDGAGVDVYLLYRCTVCGEMRQEGIQMTSGKGSIG